MKFPKIVGAACLAHALVVLTPTAVAQKSGDQTLIDKAADAAAALAAEKARQGLGISPGVATGVGVFLTPSSTASSAQDECVGTTNCHRGFPSTPPPLPPAPPAPLGYLPPTPSAEPQITTPQE